MEKRKEQAVNTVSRNVKKEKPEKASSGENGTSLQEMCLLAQALAWVAERAPILPVGYWFAMKRPVRADFEGDRYRVAKRDLLYALIQGEISATGDKAVLVRKDKWVTSEDVSVRRDDWVGEEICWEDNHLLGWEQREDGRVFPCEYEEVMVPMRELFDRFGYPKKRQPEDPKPAKRLRRGGPGDFTWEQFYVEIALIAHRSVGGLPKKQKDLEDLMHVWCEGHWHESKGGPGTPGKTTLREKIAPIYRRKEFDRPIRSAKVLANDEEWAGKLIF